MQISAFSPQCLSKSKANDMSKHLESSQTSNISKCATHRIEVAMPFN